MKELFEKITIIVPLKGREQCTFRFLDLLSKDLEYLGNPIKIIFADGGDKDLSRELLHYTNVNCEYRKFPYDSTLTDFHNKMFETVKSIRTEYCVIIDNDDYFTTNGILYIVGYLENHLNMSSARGSVKRFYNNNPQKLYENIYGTYLCSIVGLSSEERIIEQSKGPHSNWHNVMRTTDAIKSFGLLSIADPTNFRFTGQIIDYLSVVWGNSIRLNDIDFIYHGEGSERIKGIEEHFPPQNKWITQTDWTENFRKMDNVTAPGAIRGWCVYFHDFAGIFYPQGVEFITKVLGYGLNSACEIVKGVDIIPVYSPTPGIVAFLTVYSRCVFTAA
ncbi:MAG: hypothetical protein UV03_C0011G0022 [candidate division WWE3 bacterium GW2011_GWE1_42_16]|nr:MAG: hypothetical protein UV03_C0011G0022 [candidate division WWE3 bacterium GW2011_GWE1_42_16]